MTELIISILITLLFSAFFSGMEIAFVSSNKMLAEMEREEKNALPQKVLHRFYGNPSNFISTMLVGNNIALVVYGILIARLFNSTIFQGYSEAFTVPANTIISTCIVLITGEFLPKTLFKINPNKTLTHFAIPAYLCYVILYPISRFATALANGLLRIFGVKIDRNKGAFEFSRIDLDHLLQTSIDNAENEEDITDEVKIFQNALDFSKTKIKDCMIPRTEIVAIDAGSKISDLLEMFTESGKSKIVVYDGDMDHILGYIHSSEMFRLKEKHLEGQTLKVDAKYMSISSLTSEISIIQMPIVPEIMAARKLMQIFKQEKKSLGIVVDEFGGTSGIVSLEDLVEEIFGEIEDEHDTSSEIAQKISENKYILSARLEIGKVNEMYGIGLPEDDAYQTISGLILHEYASIPKINEILRIGNLEIKILKSSPTKIETVELTLIDD